MGAFKTGVYCVPEPPMDPMVLFRDTPYQQNVVMPEDPAIASVACALPDRQCLMLAKHLAIELKRGVLNMILSLHIRSGIFLPLQHLLVELSLQLRIWI
jgi:hypothetical protein